MRRSPRALALAALLALPACAPRGGAGAGAPVTDRRVLSAAELREGMAQNVSNLYFFISTRRSEWLRPTQIGPTGQVAEVQVWMDTQRLGGPATLQSIPLSAVREVRLLTPSEAHAQLGLDNLGGAILILTR